MVQEPIYIDLSSSSDEEDEENNLALGNPTSLLYFTKAFRMDVDDDDVMEIEKPASQGKVKKDRARVVRGTLDDDDCCLLDTDPGAADATPDVVSSHDTDELVMTGEKGPVACRDFPHARYLCVHFPFKSTLHSNHCAQCHCYVCDSLAPCSLWGEGNSPLDHCHASEDPIWKSLRKIAKYRPFSSVAAPTTGAADPAETTLLQTLPIAPVTPVDSPPGVVQRMATPAKRDPLVIHLKGKGRGKVSQRPHLLGVKNAQQLGVRCKKNLKKYPPSGFVPRSTSPPPSGRAEDLPPLPTLNPPSSLRRSRGRVPTIVSPLPEPPLNSPSPTFRPGRPVAATTHSHPQPPHPTPNPKFRPGRAGGGISTSASPLPQAALDTPSPNSRLGRAAPPTIPNPNSRLGKAVPPTIPNPNSRLGKAAPSTRTPHPRSLRSTNSLPNRALHQGRHELPSGAGAVLPTVLQHPQSILISNSAPPVAAAPNVSIPSAVANDDMQAPSVSAGPQRK